MAKRGTIVLKAGKLGAGVALLTIAALAGSTTAARAQADRPGEVHRVSPDLPPPYATPPVANPPRLVRQPADAKLAAPPGFTVSAYLTGLVRPRFLATAPNGDIFVAESAAGRVSVVRAPAGAAQASQHEVFAGALDRPFGIAFYPPGPDPHYVYVANQSSLVRFPYRRADILEFDPDGGHKQIYASGLRNASDIAFDPASHALIAVVNERDGLGDDLPPDYLTRVKRGGFYGWPWYYIGAHPDPEHRGAHPELASSVVKPDLLFQPHSAPLGLAVYEGNQFPAAYKGDVFVALHGSWNRATRTGYKIVRARMKDGAPTGEYEDFVTGFLLPNGAVWGRPVGVTVAQDGALIFSDDGSGTLWRVAYTGKR